MEALWNLEDKWKLTTQESLLLLVCTAVAVVGLCTATILKRKGAKGEGGEGGGVGWQSHNSESPVWQRPILMGEKCELPRFSGLILYDERGKLLDHSVKETFHNDDIQQEKTAAVVRTTLRDLL
ncbi:Transmembrane protein [Melia azedarach]|uniref:Transmembrane protein n=1 Tax=Melia azedarach TaxID=155640 RepID=A0ACC1YTL3_MELAZ|nr:Transmembrane protein [Melia azedarach]